MRLGFRRSIAKILERLRFSSKEERRILLSEWNTSQTTLESAAKEFSPSPYEGDALLLLAKDRPRHVNFEPEWESLLPRLTTRWINGHHLDLTEPPVLQDVAAEILSDLSATEYVRPETPASAS
jgi:thioesterase domain-containing protein